MFFSIFFQRNVSLPTVVSYAMRLTGLIFSGCSKRVLVLVLVLSCFYLFIFYILVYFRNITQFPFPFPKVLLKLPPNRTNHNISINESFLSDTRCGSVPDLYLNSRIALHECIRCTPVHEHTITTLTFLSTKDPPLRTLFLSTRLVWSTLSFHLIVLNILTRCIAPNPPIRPPTYCVGCDTEISPLLFAVQLASRFSFFFFLFSPIFELLIIFTRSLSLISLLYSCV